VLDVARVVEKVHQNAARLAARSATV
jgi:hypothetical protein